MVKIMKNKTMETKNISVTDKQFESLVRAVAIAGSVYGVMGDMVDEKYKKQSDAMDEVEKILSGRAHDFGLGKIIEEYDGSKVIDLQTDWYDAVLDDLSEYDKYATFETLAGDLGRRDFRAKYSEEEIKKMGDKHNGYLGVPLYDFENKYYEEFNKHDYDRLFIDKNK